MNDIGPGDWVECLDNSPAPNRWLHPEDKIIIGNVYQVTDCFINWRGIACVGIFGYPRTKASAYHGHRCGYRISRFRPIYRPKASIIEGLKAPVKVGA